MSTLEWMRQEFTYGYSSGDILAEVPDPTRETDERHIGGCYRTVFHTLVAPNLRAGAKVLELGSGRGAWTSAMLRCGAECEIHTVDFQDLGRWIDIPALKGRLVHHQVDGGDSFATVPTAAFDFFFAWGVLCHWPKPEIATLLAGARRCMKPGARAVVQYAAWEKLDAFGWERGGVPTDFRERADTEIWWPRNTVAEMDALCRSAGWTVLQADCGIVERDGVALLEASGPPVCP